MHTFLFGSEEEKEAISPPVAPTVAEQPQVSTQRRATIQSALQKIRKTTSVLNRLRSDSKKEDAPKSRLSTLLGKLKQKGKEEAASVDVDVDEDFLLGEDSVSEEDMGKIKKFVLK